MTPSASATVTGMLSQQRDVGVRAERPHQSGDQDADPHQDAELDLDRARPGPAGRSPVRPGARARSRRRARCGTRSAPILARSAFTWLSTVRVPDGAGASPTPRRRGCSRVSTTPGLGGQAEQQVELGRRQVHLVAGDPDPAGGGVDPEVAERRVASGAPGTRQLGTRARRGAAARRRGRRARASGTAWSGSRRHRRRAPPGCPPRRPGRSASAPGPGARPGSAGTPRARRTRGASRPAGRGRGRGPELVDRLRTVVGPDERRTPPPSAGRQLPG